MKQLHAFFMNIGTSSAENTYKFPVHKLSLPEGCWLTISPKLFRNVLLFVG